MIKICVFFALRIAHRLRCAIARTTGHVAEGVHGIVLTNTGHLVLVRHSYMKGWHLPGGGSRRKEDAEAAMLRELREEVGLIGYRRLVNLGRTLETHAGRSVRMTTFLVDGASYTFHPSLEIAEVREVRCDDLPDDAGVARQRLAAAGISSTTDPTVKVCRTTS